MLRSPKNIVHTLVTIFSLFLLGPSPAKADIRFSGDDGMVNINIEGDITSKTADKFIETYELFQENDQYFYHRIVYLNSEGGNIDAAMKIGRYLREQQAQAVITNGSKCFSSCVLIYVGAVSRSNYGQIGLHRPYIHASDASQRSSEEEIRKMYSDVKHYLQEMDINDELYRLMMATPPEEMLVLNMKDERLSFLIPDEDPVHSEIQLQNRAFQIGISTSELRRRDAWADQNCYQLYDTSKDVVTCMEAARWGLNVETFRIRSSIAHATCKLTVGEKWDNWDECMRHNMSDMVD